MVERIVEGPDNRYVYEGELINHGEIFVGADGLVTHYREEYRDDSYSEGWRTELDFATALESLMSSQLIPDNGGYDIEELSDGSWTVSTDQGTYYCTTDPSEVVVAGVMSYPEGLPETDIGAWRTLTHIGEI